MKNIFIITQLFSTYVISGMTAEHPEGHGVKYKQDYYQELFKDKSLVQSSERINNFLTQCKEELRLQTKCTNIPLYESPCNEKQSKTLENINYCTSIKSNKLTIHKEFKIQFRSYDGKHSNVTKAEKDMFYSAVNCMKATYEHYNINLELNLIETHPPEIHDISIYKRMIFGDPDPHNIPLSTYTEVFDHAELCQLVTHEFTHHLGVPDRYEFRDNQCPLARVYEPGSIMSSLPKLGYKGLSFLEEDLFSIMRDSCPKTIKNFQKFKDHPCPRTIEILPEKQNQFLNQIKNILNKLFK